jgi:hypothetical protein
MTGQADNVFSRPGPRMVDAGELLAKILHPLAFNVSLPHVISDDYVDWVSSDQGVGLETHSVEGTGNLAMAVSRSE